MLNRDVIRPTKNVRLIEFRRIGSARPTSVAQNDPSYDHRMVRLIER